MVCNIKNDKGGDGRRERKKRGGRYGWNKKQGKRREERKVQGKIVLKDKEWTLRQGTWIERRIEIRNKVNTQILTY